MFMEHTIFEYPTTAQLAPKHKYLIFFQPPNAYYHDHKNSPLDTILSQMNPFHFPIHFQANIYIIFHLHPYELASSLQFLNISLKDNLNDQECVTKCGAVNSGINVGKFRKIVLPPSPLSTLTKQQQDPLNFGTPLPDNSAITSWKALILTHRQQNIKSHTKTYKLLYETFKYILLHLLLFQVHVSSQALYSLNTFMKS